MDIINPALKNIDKSDQTLFFTYYSLISEGYSSQMMAQAMFHLKKTLMPQGVIDKAKVAKMLKLIETSENSILLEDLITKLSTRSESVEEQKQIDKQVSDSKTIYRCPVCKKQNMQSVIKQLRSGDEASDHIMICMSCGKIDVNPSNMKIYEPSRNE